MTRTRTRTRTGTSDAFSWRITLLAMPKCSTPQSCPLFTKLRTLRGEAYHKLQFRELRPERKEPNSRIQSDVFFSWDNELTGSGGRVTMYYAMNTLSIRVPDELRADLQQISRRQNKPVSDVVRESIRRYVAIEKFRALRKKVLPFAEAQGYLTDEDVFKAIS